MDNLNDRIAKLSPAKRNLFELALTERGLGGLAEPGIPRVHTAGPAPLSFAQQRLWFLDQLEPNSPLYNLSRAVRLSGPLNIEALRKTLDALVARHEALRTTFAAVDGNPLQVINQHPTVDLAMIDLSGRSEGEREEESRRLLKQEAYRPFNLVSDLMLRPTLIRLAAEEHLLQLVMHHIASDGWSSGVLFRELSALYEAFVNGTPSPLSELPIQYADFALWQRDYLQGEVLQSQLSYWKNQLAGLPPPLELAPGRPRPAVRTHEGATQSFMLSPTLSKALKSLSRREGATLYMTLLAAFKTLLYRYTGQHDLAIGSPIAGRNRPETEGCIGFFVNTLVLRTDLSGNITFRELLRRVRKVSLEAFTHQDLPYEKLVEVLHPKRNASHGSLTQIAFAFQNVPRAPLNLSGLTVVPMRLDRASAKLDLTLFMWETEEGLSGSIEYLTDLFDAADIDRMLAHFQTLLEAVVADPERRLLDTPPFIVPTLSAKAPVRGEKFDVYETSNLTRNQLLIWAGQKLHPEVPLYNVVSTYSLTGELDPDHFKKAFQTLVNSSDVLRTVIQEIDGIPRQKVLPDFPYELEYLDFSRDSEPRAAFQTWLQTRCRVQFNLEERLFDCALAKITESQFVWCLNQHHIITDGWSISLIFRWMSEFYQRSLEGRLEQRIKLPSFQDYIDYERENRTSPHYLEAENYWERKLAEEFEPVNFYGKTPLKRTSQVRRISYDLGTERTQNLKCLASREEISGRTEHASMFNIFAALLFTYLYRVTGNRHPSIGTPYHNRPSKAFKDTLGLIMEVLLLRITIGENDTFLSLIQKIRFEASQVFRFSHTIANSPQNKVYDVVLNYHTASSPMFGGISVQKEWVHTGYENDSLALQIHDFDASGSFVLDFDFHCDVFDESQSHQAVQHFFRILDTFLENPAQLLHCVNLLSSEETEQVLQKFNETHFALPKNLTIPQLFEEQVHRRPDHVAVRFEGQSLTYSELNTRANWVARYLQSLGVGPEKIVGLCAESSPEALVGMLGILKAGGAYLALDPEYPKERLAFMLQDAGVSVLLTQERLLGQFPGLAEIIERNRTGRGEAGTRSVVYLDRDWPAIDSKSGANPDSGLSSDHLAYVIYTSGSTGKAKAVMVQHGGLCNRLLWAREFYRLGATDRVLQKSSFSYDASVWEIFEPLLAGAQVVLARPKGRQDSAYLVQLMAEHEVTVAEFVPSMIGVLLEEKGIERCSSLKRVFSGGEALSVELQERFFARLSSELYNTYGPTEASIDVAHWKCRSGTDQRTVPIGRPIANTQIYILDSHLNPVPIGLPGELHIGGIGLARGYLNRPELTAEKFIPNPLSDAPGAGLYKTGDLALYLPDGNIEFLGRIDHQVKIRGFRVELGEIESVLGQHPAIRESLVVAVEDIENAKGGSRMADRGGENPKSEIQNPKSGRNRLVAYLVSKQEPAPTTTELRSFLKDKLPGYMLPSAFVFLKSLPLTASGKVNRQALPAPDPMRPELEGAFVPPRTPTESIIAKIWRELLGVDRVGVHDDFFDLGGHSLLAVRLFARIEKELGKKPPLSSLFERATVEHLASLLAEPTPSSGSSSLVAIQPHGSKPPFFCVHEFFGDVLCYSNLARHLGEDQPFYALQARGLDGSEEPFTDIKAMAAYYVKEIRTVQPKGPYALGGLCIGGVVAFEMALQLRAKGEEVALVALLDSGINSKRGRRARWLSFLRNLPRDLPSWLIGSFQLDRSQWLSLINLKFRRLKARRTALSHSSGGASHQDHASKLIKEMGDLFGFSERHRSVARAQYQALRRYKPQVYPGRVTLFRARMQPFFSSHNPDKGWGPLAAGGLDIRVVPGNHLGMLQEPHVRVLAEKLRACLGRDVQRLPLEALAHRKLR